VAIAREYVRERGLVPERAGFLRSRRDPRWAAVSGITREHEVWAVWLRIEEGRWRPREAFLGKGENSPASVPCDIRPPFSEPEC
jgi:hypothetical protein